MKIFGLGVVLLNLLVPNYPVAAYEPETLSIYKTIAAHESSALEAAYRAVKNKLASKVFLMPNTSIIWGAKIPENDEVLMLTIGKTTKLNDIMNTIDYKRPFTGFEVVASKISDGCAPYLDWATNYASGNTTVACPTTGDQRQHEIDFATLVMSQKYGNSSLADTLKQIIVAPEPSVDAIKEAEDDEPIKKEKGDETDDDEEEEDEDNEREEEAAQKEKEELEKGITEPDEEYNEEQEEEEEAEREKEEERQQRQYQAEWQTPLRANARRNRGRRRNPPNYDYEEADGWDTMTDTAGPRGSYRARSARRSRGPNRVRMPNNEADEPIPLYDDYAEAQAAQGNPNGVKGQYRARGARKPRGPYRNRMPNDDVYEAMPSYDYVEAAAAPRPRKVYQRRKAAGPTFQTAIVQEMAPTNHHLNELHDVVDAEIVHTIEEDAGLTTAKKTCKGMTNVKATRKAKSITKEEKMAKKSLKKSAAQKEPKTAKAKAAPKKTIARKTARIRMRKAKVTINRPQAYANHYRTLPPGDGLFVAKRKQRTIVRPIKSRIYARQRALLPAPAPAQAHPIRPRIFPLKRVQPSNSRNLPVGFPQSINLGIYPMIRAQRIRQRNFPVFGAQPAHPRNFPIARPQPVNSRNFPVVRRQPAQLRNFQMARVRLANLRNFQRPVNYRNVPALPALPAISQRWPMLPPS